ncbi:2-ketoglutarate ferredoxin oxidoreductase subunit delta [Archaeoglobales archaeon]|nr:MAG: 2-ketoglutarate ferredoxin oxidoreductase subunit delta [Archaeoglobales archaeon ex4484_92]RLI79272.1 MAG: 2-ketoglutarate ferredoxin oxidoreductase subunit delta [Archaeoglobales archaeon]
MYKIAIDKSLCKECGICVDICPKKVISLSKNVIVSKECAGCKLCVYYCPDFAIDVVKYDGACTG